MSLQSDDIFTVVLANDVNLSTFKTNSYEKPELDLFKLESNTVDVGANMLAEVVFGTLLITLASAPIKFSMGGTCLV